MVFLKLFKQTFQNIGVKHPPFSFLPKMLRYTRFSRAISNKDKLALIGPRDDP